MGMFDYVNTPPIKCPKCGSNVTGFQTKDLGCVLIEVDYKQVQQFYTSCKKCGLWIMFNRTIPAATSLDDFTMIHEDLE